MKIRKGLLAAALSLATFGAGQTHAADVYAYVQQTIPAQSDVLVSVPAVRTLLVQRQRELADGDGSVVVEGADALELGYWLGRRFWAVWSGQTVSAIGSEVSGLGIAVYVFVAAMDLSGPARLLLPRQLVAGKLTVQDPVDSFAHGSAVSLACLVPLRVGEAGDTPSR